MIPLYVLDIARQHRAAHPGHLGGIPRRRLALALAVASCTLAAVGAMLLIEVIR